MILARADRDPAVRMLTLIDQRPDDIVRVTDEDEQRARAIITQYRDKTFSLVDAISIAAMERLGITDAFAFDRHFVQYGFRLVTDST